MKFSITPGDHLPWCPFRRAIESPAAIECEHGWDHCPYCDPCICADELRKARAEHAAALPRPSPAAPEGGA